MSVDALLLVNHRGSTLLMDDIANRAILIMIANLRLTEAVQLPRAHRVQIDRERERDEEANQRDTHGDMVALVIGHETGEGREEGAARDGSHDPRGAALGVAAEATDREGEDGGEDAGFEEEDQRERSDSAFALGAHGGGDEDHDAGEEDHEDPSRFGDHHAAGGGEATDGEETLADGVAVRALRLGDFGALDRVFDELGRDPDLCTDVAELSGHAEEELVLLPHGLVNIAGETGALFGLESHVGIGDFWDRGEEKDEGEKEDKGGDAEVGPLHVGEVVGVGGFEEHAGCEKWGHHGADCLERLGELETEF